MRLYAGFPVVGGRTLDRKGTGEVGVFPCLLTGVGGNVVRGREGGEHAPAGWGSRNLLGLKEPSLFCSCPDSGLVSQSAPVLHLGLTQEVHATLDRSD